MRKSQISKLASWAGRVYLIRALLEKAIEAIKPFTVVRALECGEQLNGRPAHINAVQVASSQCLPGTYLLGSQIRTKP